MSGVDKSLEGGKKYWGVPAEEARKKWRELAYLKKLPDFINGNNGKTGINRDHPCISSLYSFNATSMAIKAHTGTDALSVSRKLFSKPCRK